MRKRIITKSEQETREFGQMLAKSIKPGTVLGLTGELGSGKTQLVKGLAGGLRMKGVIASPTFAILKSYKLKVASRKWQNLIHVDCYRLNNPRELLDLGLEEYIKSGNNIIAIEWAEQVKSILPKHTIWIRFKVNGKNEREIEINPQ